MAKSVAKIRFETRPVKTGPGWLVTVEFPDRPEMHVENFATEADAKNWITNDSWVWLKKWDMGISPQEVELRLSAEMLFFGRAQLDVAPNLVGR